MQEFALERECLLLEQFLDRIDCGLRFNIAQRHRIPECAPGRLVLRLREVFGIGHTLLDQRGVDPAIEQGVADYVHADDGVLELYFGIALPRLGLRTILSAAQQPTPIR
jgi:hypothetical protein